MISKYKHGNITWLDLENPDTEEIRRIIEDYDIDPIVAEELLTPSARPRVDLHENYIYLILHFPTDNKLEAEHDPILGNYNQEVDFIISKKFIITTRYDSVDAMHQFSKVFEVNSILDKSNIDIHAGYVFFYMLQYLYRALMNRLESIQDQINDIEENIFKGSEKEMVFEISKTTRKLLNYKESLLFHEEILKSFESIGQKFFEPKFGNNLRKMQGEFHKVYNTLETTKEHLKELRETNDSLLSTKQNEITKVLTVTAFITFPATLIASIFGMNTVNNPIVGHPQDFVIILGIMLMMGLLMFIYFRGKKWL